MASDRGLDRVAGRRRASRDGRRAMTLLEIVLTLSLLVILAAVTWPALGRPMARQRLRQSADQVRAEWVRARVDAMSTNRTYVFRFTPDSDTYTVQAYASEDEAAWDLSLTSDETESPLEANSRQRRLADKIRFVAGETGTAAAAGGLRNDDALTSSGFDQRIFFYSDGTCSDAQLQLANEYGRTIILSLRGLTGVVTVSEPVSSETAAP